MIEERIEKLLESCTACPRNCRVNRLSGEKGFCRSGLKIKIASLGPHLGEEPPISGKNGSGAIFFTNCNLNCLFCQNYQISQEGLGFEITEEELAGRMLHLQKMGCHNINLVSPTHHGPQILKTLIIAKEKGLKIPIVYNSNGYDSCEMLKLFEGYVDIYLPDIKYSDNGNASKYSGVKDYVEYNRLAITEMLRQVGNLNDGIGKRGLIVRHLVLPSDIAGSYQSLKFLASLSKDIWISVMSQYHPCYKAAGHPVVGRKITANEYNKVIDRIEDLGFENVLVQEMKSSDIFLPDFKRSDPFESSPHF